MIERLLAGEAALARDELDAAERLFRQVADADPRNAIAHAGLARVAIRHGDVDGARSLAEQALAIDPGEAAAARLLVELDRPVVPNSATELDLSPVPDLAPVPTPAPVAAQPPAQAAVPSPARGGWRAWLARLLRRS
jgi:tetratricopeptide (TPR) repeat protein